MGKLLVFYILIPVFLRFRLRKNPRLKAKVYPWFYTFTAILLLVVIPWNPSHDVAALIFYWLRLSAALALGAFLAFDMRKALSRRGGATVDRPAG